ncbi:MAG: hypothetical protein BRD28_04875, partial [Bacteroidetes bacterium QH_10_64_37]
MGIETRDFPWFTSTRPVVTARFLGLADRLAGISFTTRPRKALQSSTSNDDQFLRPAFRHPGRPRGVAQGRGAARPHGAAG